MSRTFFTVLLHKEQLTVKSAFQSSVVLWDLGYNVQMYIKLLTDAKEKLLFCLRGPVEALRVLTSTFIDLKLTDKC